MGIYSNTSGAAAVNVLQTFHCTLQCNQFLEMEGNYSLCWFTSFEVNSLRSVSQCSGAFVEDTGQLEKELK